MRIAFFRLRGPAQELSDRVKFHASHNQSTGEGIAIAMPRVSFELSLLNSRDETAPRAFRIWNHCAPTRLFAQLFES